MEKIIKVEGMSCSHCEKAVKEALSQLEGVDNVSVDLDLKEVEVKGAGLVDEKLKEAIEDAGYEVVQIN